MGRGSSRAPVQGGQEGAGGLALAGARDRRPKAGREQRRGNRLGA